MSSYGTDAVTVAHFASFAFPLNAVPVTGCSSDGTNISLTSTGTYKVGIGVYLQTPTTVATYFMQAVRNETSVAIPASAIAILGAAGSPSMWLYSEFEVVVASLPFTLHFENDGTPSFVLPGNAVGAPNRIVNVQKLF